MHEPHRAGGRQMRGQPLHQPLHLVDLLGLRGAVLLRPAVDLACDVVLALAVIGKADLRRLVGVQLRERRIHRVVDRGALRRVGARHIRLPDHAALDAAHHVERRAGDALVGAIDDRLGDRESLGVQRADRLELAVDRMRGGEQLARRLAPQHVFARRRFQHVGRIRLAAAELLHGERALEARRVRREVGLQPRHIEAQRRRDLLGARIGRLPVDLGHAFPAILVRPARCRSCRNRRP